MKKIALRGKNGIGKFALVDDEDYEKLAPLTWRLSGGYPAISRRAGGIRTIYMHRMVLDHKSRHTDHINGNKLDNRKSNLRACSPGENTRNTGPRKGRKYKGTSTNGKHWRAYLMHEGVEHIVRGFDTEKDAAIMYNYLAKRYHGDFAFLNKIYERGIK